MVALQSRLKWLCASDGRLNSFAPAYLLKGHSMTTGKAKVIGSFISPEGDKLIEAIALKEREGRHSIAEAILRLQAETSTYFALHKAVDTGAIPSYAPGKLIQITCNPSQRDMREEVYWEDLNNWLAENYPRVTFRFPNPSAAPATPAAPVVASEWVIQAQTRAREIVKESTARNVYPSQVNLGDQIASEFRKAGISGADGKPLAGATIKRHALAGISSATGRQLSTTIGRGK